jgi:nucleoredoxin
VLSELFEAAEDEYPNLLQVVFASSDHDEASFTEYYGHMPWLAVPFTSTEKIQELGHRFSVKGN